MVLQLSSGRFPILALVTGPSSQLLASPWPVEGFTSEEYCPPAHGSVPPWRSDMGRLAARASRAVALDLRGWSWMKIRLLTRKTTGLEAHPGCHRRRGDFQIKHVDELGGEARRSDDCIGSSALPTLRARAVSDFDGLRLQPFSQRCPSAVGGAPLVMFKLAARVWLPGDRRIELSAGGRVGDARPTRGVFQCIITRLLREHRSEYGRVVLEELSRVPGSGRRDSLRTRSRESGTWMQLQLRSRRRPARLRHNRPAGRRPAT